MEQHPYIARTPEDVFNDFRGRRSAIVRALTIEVDKFTKDCDPERENLCLYGYPNETWDVNLPAEEVPPELPEPALGINFARDGMDRKDWLDLVAVHSDTWLLAVAYYFAARFGFDRDDRSKLFRMINDLPTISEVVNGMAKKPKKAKTPNSSSKSSSKSGSKQQKRAREENEEAEEDEDQTETLCSACGESEIDDEFWICCDVCEKWFHGKCVRITPARAESIKKYKCPACQRRN